jgi:diguanylate cyclase (GGDEF)-like protein/PAS domain S-box-containing protein
MRANRKKKIYYDAQLEDLGRYIPMLLINPDTGDIVDANQAASDFYGYSYEEMVTKKITDINIEARGELFKDMKRAKRLECRRFCFNHRLSDGQIRCVEVYSGPIKVDGKNLLYEIIHDVTEQRRVQQALRESEEKYRDFYDTLTGLPSRALLNENFFQKVKEQKDNEMLAVMFLDLDNFKNINNTLGYATGDKLLKAVAQKLKHCLRRTDILARMGGDEFIVLLPDIIRKQDVEKVALKILDTLNEPFKIDGYELFISTSIGISIYPYDGKDFESLVKNADIAMYRAKNLGKNSYQIYSPNINMLTLGKLNLGNSLRRAIEREEFEIYYQPKVDIRTGEIIGMEALLRWNHPDAGRIMPDDFIPIAEETGLIVPIGEWVIRKACEQNKAWQDAGYPALPVAVNISTTQLKKRDLAETIAQILVDTGLKPDYLELEVTESAVIHSLDYVINALSELKKIGVTISMDDFGTGYSSLVYINRLAVDSLKIDRSFIQELNTNPSNKPIVSAIIAMAHNLNIKVIAEGVDKSNQLIFLARNKCDCFQGYLFSPPVPSHQFEKMLSNREKFSPKGGARIRL